MAPREDFPIRAGRQVKDADYLYRALQDESIIIVGGLSFAEFYGSCLGLGSVLLHPDASEDGVSTITPDYRSAQDGGGYTLKPLSPHTDRSRMDHPPEFICMYFEHIGAGGQPTIVDLAELLETRGDDFTGLNLQEHSTSRRLPIIYGGPGRFIRYRDDDHWAPVGDEMRIMELRAIIQRSVRTLNVSDGQAYIISNRKCLHGRTEIRTRDRVAKRILISRAHSHLESEM